MDLKLFTITEKESIREAMKKLDQNAGKILILEEDNKVKGVITDGDIRRWILKNGDLGVSVSYIVNNKPICITEYEKDNAYEIMKNNSIEALPVIGVRGELNNIIFWNEIEKNLKKENNTLRNVPVVIMAGGLGTRLYPYTKILPKALIPIGDIPITERIINKFYYHGCENYFLTLNHKKNMIKAYFGEVDKGYKVSYVEEDKPLGTGGSLYMLKDKIKETFFLTNCDILIESDYENIYKFHKENKNKITIISAIKNLVIPYGVIELENGGDINKMKEKPELSFLVNTGMYIVEPEILDYIKEEEFIGFPDIIEIARNNGDKVGVYPISENSWMDMGQINEMKNMIERLEQ